VIDPSAMTDRANFFDSTTFVSGRQARLMMTPSPCSTRLGRHEMSFP
jgi:hypothetical protein